MNFSWEEIEELKTLAGKQMDLFGERENYTFWPDGVRDDDFWEELRILNMIMFDGLENNLPLMMTYVSITHTLLKRVNDMEFILFARSMGPKPFQNIVPKHVYAIEINGRVKIGITRNFKLRLSQIQQPLRKKGRATNHYVTKDKYVNPLEPEKAILKELDHHRTGHQSEWLQNISFNEVVSTIERILQDYEKEPVK